MEINRVREALNACHSYSNNPVAVGGEEYPANSSSWAAVSVAIEDITGELIDKERLRAFVEGEMRKGVRAWPTPKRLDKIIEFLMHEDIDLLSASELKDSSPATHAPIRLLEYLRSELMNSNDKSCMAISGVFHFSYLDNDEIVFHEIRLVPSSKNDGLLQVYEKHSYFDKKHRDEFFEWSESEREEFVYSKKKFSGWAIFTPEESLIIFMKNNGTGRNHYYFSLAADKELSSSTELNSFCLMPLDYPMVMPESFDDNQQVISRLFSDYTRNVRMFTRNKQNREDG